ncbi:MAG: hypothetical protein ACLFUJ_11455 [Phycisphaerae bacterium]
MTKREKKLAAVAGTVLGLIGAVGLVHIALLSPLKSLELRENALRSQLGKAKDANSARRSMHARIKQITSQTFGLSGQATATRGDVERFLVDLQKRSDLPPLKIDNTAAPNKKGVYEGVGWSISGTGRLDKIMNFLYLLENQPYLYKIQRLTLRPDWETELIAMNLDYATILPVQLEYPKKIRNVEEPQIITGKYSGGTTAASLSSPERQRYSLLRLRDPLLRYKQKPVQVAKPPSQPRSRPRPQPKPQPRPRPQPQAQPTYRLTSTTAFGGKPQIRIENIRTGSSQVYREGDAFDGGTIVMVDYRSLPMPENPRLLSGSRIILKKGPDYWAIERGQTFSQKRLLRTDQLPETLQPQEKPEPENASADGGNQAAGDGSPKPEDNSRDKL